MSLFNKTGLVAWYPMTEGSGTTLNDYEGSNNGTISGAVWQKNKKGSYSLDFDGTNDYVDLGATTENEDLFFEGGSINAWIYIDGSGNFVIPRIISKEENNRGFIFALSDFSGGDCKLTFTIPFTDSNARWDTTSRILSTGQWYMVSVVYDSSSVSNDPVFYVNGTAYSVGSGLTENNAPVGTQISDDDDKMLLGNFRTDDTIRSFEGKMNDVIIWDRILTANEIKALYEKTYIE